MIDTGESDHFQQSVTETWAVEFLRGIKVRIKNITYMYIIFTTEELILYKYSK